MKTNLNEQVQGEYRNYLKTKAMVDYYKPLLKDIAKTNHDLKGWTITFGSDQRVLIMFYSHQEKQANLNEFTRIRGLVIDEFSYGDQPVILKAELSGFLGETLEFIQAKGDLPNVDYRHGSFRPSIEIRMFGIDKCDIEYVEKTVKEPVLTGFCAEVLQ